MSVLWVMKDHDAPMVISDHAKVRMAGVIKAFTGATAAEPPEVDARDLRRRCNRILRVH
jgi:hypothetical protein